MYGLSVILETQVIGEHVTIESLISVCKRYVSMLYGQRIYVEAPAEESHPHYRCHESKSSMRIWQKPRLTRRSPNNVSAWHTLNRSRHYLKETPP